MRVELDQIFQAAASAVEEVNLSQSDASKHVSGDLDAVLFGDGGTLDSIGLVNVVMALEAHINDLTGEDVVLASEAAMSRRNSPYRSLRALAKYAVEVANGEPIE